MMRTRVSFEDVKTQIDAKGLPQAFQSLRLPFLPDDAAVWDLMAAMIDYDPRQALERIRVPVLALFGADNPIVPVQESVAVYGDAVRAPFLTVEVFAGADHRLQTGDPPALVDGYLQALADFVLRSVA